MNKSENEAADTLTYLIETAHGTSELWLRRILFYLVPQSRDPDVDTPVEWVPLIAAETVHDEIPTKNPVGVFDENIKKFEFGSRQIYLQGIPTQGTLFRLEAKWSEHEFAVNV